MLAFSYVDFVVVIGLDGKIFEFIFSGWALLDVFSLFSLSSVYY